MQAHGFDNESAIHQNYINNRVNELSGQNKEEVQRYASEFKKIKASKKKRKKSMESTKNVVANTGLKRKSRKKNNSGLMTGFTNIMRDSTLKRNLTRNTTTGGSDTEGEEEDPMHMIEQNLHRSNYILLPHSTFKFSWDIVQLFIIVYIAFIVPFNFSFGLTDEVPPVLDIFAEILLILDIIIQMNCGFQTKGMLIMSRSKIIFNYIQSWFIADFLSALPITIFFYILIGDDIHMT